MIMLDNWREKFEKMEGQEIIDTIDQLLVLQKQALKDEAIKRIEEDQEQEKIESADFWYFQGLERAKDIIHNL